MKHENLLIYSLCILIVILISAIIINITLLNKEKTPNLSEIEIKCENKDIFLTSECLRNKLGGFYNYNKYNVGKNLNIIQLKEQGGVCEHYANWYKDNFIKLGAKEVEQKDYFKKEKTNSKFYISKIVLPITNETSHVISIVSNEKGYCILDMNEIDCIKFN